MSDIFSSDVTIEPGALPLVITDSALETSAASIDTKTPTVGQKNMAGSRPVVIASDQSPVPVTSVPVTSNTATITQVTAVNAININLVAANANRKKIVLVFPKGSAASFLKYGTGASSTSFTHLIASNNTEVVETTWTGAMDYNGTGQTVTITEMV